MSDAGAKRDIPKWGRIAIGVLSALTVALLILVGVGFWFYHSVVRSDEAGAKQTVESIVSFKTPLSGDYKYTMALNLDFAGARVGIIEHKPDKMTFVLAQLSGSNRSLTPQQVLEYQHGGQEGKFVPEKQGTETVAGQPMTYVSGKNVDTPGSETQMFAGSVSMPQQSHSMFFLAFQDKPGRANETVREDFLKNIETLK